MRIEEAAGLLGVAVDAPPEALQAAYRRLAQRWQQVQGGQATSKPAAAVGVGGGGNGKVRADACVCVCTCGWVGAGWMDRSAGRVVALTFV